MKMRWQVISQKYDLGVWRVNMTKQFISNALELVGFIIIICSLWTISVSLALLVIGILFAVIGYLLQGGET